tara:strand:+ start:313 stop:1227 length:915 start_codon:yes stop_codon:yes gene_type:complete
MANSLSNVQEIAQQTFLQGLASSTEDYARCCEVLTYEGGDAKLMTTNAGGLASEVSASTTSVSATDLTSGISTITQEAYAIKHTVPWAQLNWSMNLAEDVGMQLANAAAANLNKLYFDGLDGLFALAHPSAGAGAGQVGAGKKFLDTGLAFAQTAADAGTQSNLITDALAESSLNNARSILRKWKNQQALPMNISGANDEMVLVCGPTNEKTAMELIVSQLSGADMQVNTFRSFADVVVYPLTDEDDWFLISKTKSPVGIWIGEAPTVIAREDETGLFVNFVCKFQASFYTKAYAAGIIGSNVA